MAAKRPNRTTIIVEPEVRKSLKHIARKDQSYNEFIIELIKLHNSQNQKEEKVQEVTTPLNTDQIHLHKPHPWNSGADSDSV